MMHNIQELRNLLHLVDDDPLRLFRQRRNVVNEQIGVSQVARAPKRKKLCDLKTSIYRRNIFPFLA